MSGLSWKFLSVPLAVIFVSLCWQTLRGEAQGDVPTIVGTWKLNLAKSKLDPGSPPPKSLIIQCEWDGEHLKHTADRVNEKGERVPPVQFSAKYDGKDYPVSGSNNDSVRLRRIDAYTTEAVSKKNGKDTLTFRHVVSRDGKTMTITHTAANAKGEPVTILRVFDRQ